MSDLPKVAYSKTTHQHEIVIASPPFTATWADLEINFWKDSGGGFNVRLHDYKNGKRIFWEAFDSKQEAKKFFDEKVKEYDLTGTVHNHFVPH